MTPAERAIQREELARHKGDQDLEKKIIALEARMKRLEERSSRSDPE